MRNDCGVLLIATSPKHLAEAALCVQSIQACSDVAISLCTQLDTDLPVNVVRISDFSQSFMDKVRYLALSPYKHTLFLDTDTLVLRPDAFDVFDLLDHYDLALVHAPVIDCGLVRVTNIPASFSEFNTGVIGYRRSPRVFETFNSWESLYSQQLTDKKQWRQAFIHDQPALRTVLYGSSIRLVTLPHVFNYRCSPHLRIEQAKSIRILHNRGLQRRVLQPDGTIDLSAIARRR